MQVLVRKSEIEIKTLNFKMVNILKFMKDARNSLLKILMTYENDSRSDRLRDVFFLFRTATKPEKKHSCFSY